MMGGEASRTAPGNRNHATMFFTVSPRPDIDDAAATAAYGRASAYLSSLPATAEGCGGYRLFWVRGEQVGHKDLPEADYAIVGRHSACDIAIPAAAELSLRHLLVATTMLEGGACGLRVLDLRASLPFYTDDSQPRRSIVASGPVVLRLGTCLFGGVPLRPDAVRTALPTDMPRAIVTHSLGAEAPESAAGPAATPLELSTMGFDGGELYDPPPAVPASAAAPHTVAPRTAPSAVAEAPAAEAVTAPVPPSLRSLSRVTVVPPTSLLTEVAPSESSAVFVRLTLLREGHAASIDVPTADLDAGVLLGRSERCTDGGLRRVLDGNISRIHVLLLRQGDDVIAFDLCSTQGTYVNGDHVRRHRLPPAGGCLSLAKVNPVMLCLHPRSASSTTPSPREYKP